MVIRNSDRIEVLNTQDTEILLNLSTGGAAFLYPEGVRKDQVIIMNINDTAIQGLVIYCRRRSDGYRVGVRFSLLSPDEQAAVNRMVETFSYGVPLKFSIVPLPVM